MSLGSNEREQLNSQDIQEDAKLKKELLEAIKIICDEKYAKFINVKKTVRAGKEECESYRFYIELYKRNAIAREGGMMSTGSVMTATDEIGSGPADKKFLKYIRMGEKPKPLQEFDKIIEAVTEVDEQCGQYMYKLYYEEKTMKEINEEMNLKSRFEGYKIVNKMHFIVAVLAQEVSLY